LHSSPLRHGDSGGPLVLCDGPLVGINGSGGPGVQWKHLSIVGERREAHRADLAWLGKKIYAEPAFQNISRPLEDLEIERVNLQMVVQNQLFASLVRPKVGWSANHALQRTRRGRRGCNRCVPCAGSLSLGRWAES